MNSNMKSQDKLSTYDEAMKSYKRSVNMRYFTYKIYAVGMSLINIMACIAFLIMGFYAQSFIFLVSSIVVVYYAKRLITISNKGKL